MKKDGEMNLNEFLEDYKYDPSDVQIIDNEDKITEMNSDELFEYLKENDNE